MSKEFDAKREELLNEVREILTNAEELFDDKSKSSVDELKKLKSALTRRVNKVKADIDDLQDEAVVSAKQLIKQTDTLVQDNPYRAAGVAGVIGLLLGVLISRR